MLSLGMLAALYYVFITPKGIEIDHAAYPTRGVDLSEHSGRVDFDGLASEGNTFVFLKATEGVSYVDPKFEEYYTAAKKAGLDVGAYHFFRFNKSGKEQAQHFMRIIKDKKLNLPLVLDVEEWGNSLGGKSTDELKLELVAFSKYVQKVSGQRVMFYTNESGYNRFIRGTFDHHPLWICSFSNPPRINRDWNYWQYSHKGRSPYVEGWVDLNVSSKINR